MKTRRLGFQPNHALLEQLLRDDTGDEPLGGWAGEAVVPAKPTPAPPQPRPFIIEPPDWEAEERERKELERQREQQEREKILKEELTRLTAEDDQTYPAKKRRWRS